MKKPPPDYRPEDKKIPGGLFGPPKAEPDICANKHGGADTSAQAFNSISKETRAAQRGRILKFIDVQGGLGATCEEIGTAINMRYTSASARISELSRDGLIRDSGQRRNTATGRSARVYVVAPKP